MGSDAKVQIDESLGGYGMFQTRAAQSHAKEDELWRVGFERGFRAGFEEQIAAAIFNFFDQVQPEEAQQPMYLLDIGAGSSQLTDAVTLECETRGLRHVLVDSPEMLAHAELKPSRVHVAGRFPEVSETLATNIGEFHLILAYSVLQYVARDMSIESFFDGVLSLLAPGGVALIGDIPNRDQRDRQCLADGRPVPDRLQGEIRDVELLNAVMRIRKLGYNAFLCPQVRLEPLRRHRENLCVIRPHGANPGGLE